MTSAGPTPADSPQGVERDQSEDAHGVSLFPGCTLHVIQRQCAVCAVHMATRLAATWESYTRRMSKQIRWKEAADLQSLGCFQDSGLRFSAAEGNVNQAG